MDILFTPDINEYLDKAQECLDKRKHFTEYELLIESCISDEKAREIAEDEMLLESAGDYIKKAIDAIKKIFEKIAESVKDFIDRMKLKGDEKDAFDAFEKACKEDPSLAKKKITVKDYRKIIKVYDEEIEKLEAAMKDSRKSDNEIQKIMDSVSDKIKSLPNAGMVAAVTIATDVAIRAAKDNIQVAEVIQKACKSDSETLNRLLDVLGDKEKKNFEKEINKATKKISLARLIAKFRHQEERYLSDAVSDTLDAVKKGGLFLPTSRMGRIMSNNEETAEAMKELKKQGAKLAVKHGPGMVKDKLFGKNSEKKSDYDWVYGYLTKSHKKDKKEKTTKESVEILTEYDDSWVDSAVDSLFE